jgi:hypothetical protein
MNSSPAFHWTRGVTDWEVQLPFSSLVEVLRKLHRGYIEDAWYATNVLCICKGNYSGAGIHSKIFVVLLLVLSSCYSQSHLAMVILCCYSFLKPEAFFLGGGGFVYFLQLIYRTMFLHFVKLICNICLFVCCGVVAYDLGLSTHALYFGL